MAWDKSDQKKASKKYSNSDKGKAYKKAWLDAHPGYMKEAGRASSLRKKYGITISEYESLLVQQGGVCAICRRQETSRHNNEVKKLSVDHCHHTGKIRGLLCFNCNYAIGHMAEDPLRMRAAASYIEAHHGKR